MEIKRFSRAEFLSLFDQAIARCLEVLKTKYTDQMIPSGILFTFSSAAGSSEAASGNAPNLRNRDQAADVLLHEDGRFRPTIRLSPVGLTDTGIVIEISWGDSCGDEDWIEVLPRKEVRFKYEPFVVMGPDLALLDEQDQKLYEAGQPLSRKLRLPQI